MWQVQESLCSVHAGGGLGWLMLSVWSHHGSIGSNYMVLIFSLKGVGGGGV